MNTPTKYLSVLFVTILFYGCKSEEPTKESGSLVINVQHEVDNMSIEQGKIMYKNAANNVYSITRLEYYLSNFKFVDADGEVVGYNDVFYINAFDTSTHTLVFDNLPSANYSEVRYNFGLTPAQNTSNSLPNTNENANMFWPEMMGGGYHFMKLEGRFKDSTALTGYAIHLGTNVCELELVADIDVSSINNVSYLNLLMNVNE